MTSKKNMDNLSLDTNSDDDMSTASRFSHCQSSSNLPSADNMSIEPVNILLLGMSYPSIKETLQRKNAYIRLKHNDLSVDQAVELVGKKILSQADGRDYARITAVEASNEIRAYTVSYKKGGRYDDERHLSADFCHHSFLSQMRGLWGTVKFRKVRNSMLSRTNKHIPLPRRRRVLVPHHRAHRQWRHTRAPRVSALRSRIQRRAVEPL